MVLVWKYSIGKVSSERTDKLNILLVHQCHQLVLLGCPPVYPFDTEDDKNGISYEEWIKTYKPYLVRTIPRDVAEQWLMQANDILEQIKKIWKKNEKGI